MARKLRVEYEGAIYHVMNRGDRKEPIVRDDQDCHQFIETLGEACEKTGWHTHAYMLMPNHFHLVIETPQANLVVGMKWLLGTFTGRFNRRHKLTGHLFSGRYKSIIVDGSGNGYLRTACDYAYLNPARAHMLTSEQSLATYPWSSWPMYLRKPHQRPSWLHVNRLLGEHGIPNDSAAGRRELERRVEAIRHSEAGQGYEAIRRDWCLGDDAFRQELLGRMHERVGAEHYGSERRGTDEAKAERIIAEEFAKLGWKESDG